MDSKPAPQNIQDGFLNLARIKPFVQGNAGWAWTNNNLKTKNDSFAYLVGAGAEFQAGERLRYSSGASATVLPR